MAAKVAKFHPKWQKKCRKTPKSQKNLQKKSRFRRVQNAVFSIVPKRRSGLKFSHALLIFRGGSNLVFFFPFGMRENPYAGAMLHDNSLVRTFKIPFLHIAYLTSGEAGRETAPPERLMSKSREEQAYTLSRYREH